MYSKLFNTITDVLPHVGNSKVVEILKQAQIDAEEMYIDAENRGILGIDKGQNY